MQEILRLINLLNTSPIFKLSQKIIITDYVTLQRIVQHFFFSNFISGLISISRLSGSASLTALVQKQK